MRAVEGIWGKREDAGDDRFKKIATAAVIAQSAECRVTQRKCPNWGGATFLLDGSANVDTIDSVCMFGDNLSRNPFGLQQFHSI